MTEILAVRRWTRVFCGAQNGHCQDKESHFALTTDGREIPISSSQFERFKGFLPWTEGHREMPGQSYGGDFSSMAGISGGSAPMASAAILGQLGYSRAMV